MSTQLQLNIAPRLDGSTLRAARLSVGLHQHQLASKLGVNQGRVCEWEAGRRAIPSQCVLQILMVLEQLQPRQ